ncbi:hypothetical protein ABT294_41765 [Nonomuraea sp. NPDC000554]
MSQTFMPRLAAPVERTITGAPASDAAGATPSFTGAWNGVAFADEGDE